MWLASTLPASRPAVVAPVVTRRERIVPKVWKRGFSGGLVPRTNLPTLGFAI
jgi:hypothetical protein